MFETKKKLLCKNNNFFSKLPNQSNELIHTYHDIDQTNKYIPFKRYNELTKYDINYQIKVIKNWLITKYDLELNMKNISYQPSHYSIYGSTKYCEYYRKYLEYRFHNYIYKGYTKYKLDLHLYETNYYIKKVSCFFCGIYTKNYYMINYCSICYKYYQNHIYIKEFKYHLCNMKSINICKKCNENHIDFTNWKERYYNRNFYYNNFDYKLYKKKIILK